MQKLEQQQKVLLQLKQVNTDAARQTRRCLKKHTIIKLRDLDAASVFQEKKVSRDYTPNPTAAANSSWEPEAAADGPYPDDWASPSSGSSVSKCTDLTGPDNGSGSYYSDNEDALSTIPEAESERANAVDSFSDSLTSISGDHVAFKDTLKLIQLDSLDMEPGITMKDHSLTSLTHSLGTALGTPETYASERSIEESPKAQ